MCTLYFLLPVLTTDTLEINFNINPSSILHLDTCDNADFAFSSSSSKLRLQQIKNENFELRVIITEETSKNMVVYVKAYLKPKDINIYS